MKMIEVHAEVFAVSPSFVTRVTQKVAEAVSEEITRVIECVTEFNENGRLQVRTVTNSRLQGRRRFHKKS